MLSNDNVSTYVKRLYCLQLDGHVTWKSPDPMCGWVGRILHPTSVSSWSKVPLIHLVCRWHSLCLSVDHFCLVPVDDMVLFYGMVCDGWLVSYTDLPCPGGSGLCTSCERVHFFLVFLDAQTKLPACLSNIRAGAVLARDTIDQIGLLFITAQLTVLTERYGTLSFIWRTRSRMKKTNLIYLNSLVVTEIAARSGSDV